MPTEKRPRPDRHEQGLFTSRRERTLWILAGLVLATIYATLGVARTLVDLAPDRRFIDSLFVAGFSLAVTAVVVVAVRLRPRGVEIGLLVGVVAVYLMALARLGIPEERTHLFEYSILGVLVYEALRERSANGRTVPAVPMLAIAVTALLGWFDEAIQAVLPNRVYDLRDVGFNALAATLAIVASVTLGRARARARRST